MNYWLVKSDPDSYGWPEMKKDKKTYWDGVRNYQARNNMKEMKKGDRVLFYHSVQGKEIVGEVEVVKESYQDPTTDDDRWVAVDFKVIGDLENPVTLQQIKDTESLSEIALVRNSRLSVMPLDKKDYNTIIKMSK